MIRQMRSRVGLYTPSETPDDMGGASRTWGLSQVIWAGVKPYNLSEAKENGRLAVLQPYKVTIRYMANFPERARLMWQGRILRVIAASDPDDRRERLQLICEEEAQ